MGCIVSTQKETGGNRRRPANIGDVAVFVPGLRIPKASNFSESLDDHLSKSLVERLSALRTRIVVMAGQEAPTITRTRRKTATQHGYIPEIYVSFSCVVYLSYWCCISWFLQEVPHWVISFRLLKIICQCFSDWLKMVSTRGANPLIKLSYGDCDSFYICRESSATQSTVHLGQSRRWNRGQTNNSIKNYSLFIPLNCLSHYPHLCLQETAMYSAWYEVLSVLHLMATLSLSQANLLLLPRTSVDGYQPKVSEGRCYGFYVKAYIFDFYGVVWSSMQVV